jgi:LysM repeat protein
LSENGFNSKDYSERSSTDQAAGMAYAWNKIRDLDSIESGTTTTGSTTARRRPRIGLRKFPDEPGDPFGKKPIWHLYDVPVIAANERPPANATPLPPARSSSSKPAASGSSSASRPKPASPKPVAAKPKPKPKPTSVTYTVKKGDTLSGIASRHGSTVAKIRSANGISGSMIHPGQRLRIPKR